MASKKNRIKKLRRKFAEKEIDAIFISQPENRFYLSGFNGSDGFLLITESEELLATDFRYTEQASAEAPDFDVFRIAGPIREWFPKLVADLKLERLGFESGHMPFSLYREISKIMEAEHPASAMVPLDGVVEDLRMVKDKEEIEFITRAVQLSDDAFNYIEDTVDTDITERELAWEIEKYVRDRGSQGVPFDIIVASGPNASMPHHRPGSRVIRSGDCVVIDMGARSNDYTSDLTRTICPGKRSKPFKKVYDTVLKAQLTALSGIRAGMTGAEADNIARNIITAAGHGDAFGHSLGHGVGLATHEKPRLGQNSTDVLENGMVFTVEPGIYLAGWGGVRIEDTVVMDDGKIRVLSQARKL